MAVLVLAVALAGAAPEAGAPPPVPAAPAAVPATNELCPVMEGNKVDPNIFVIYQGKRVQFCCNICKAAFEREPEKYLAKLPQFAGQAPKPRGGAWAAKLIEPTGVAALVLMVVTVLAGAFMRKAPKLLFKGHRVLGIVTLAAVLLHAAMVWISNPD
jgi:YHS domain-containing protein